MAKVSNEVRLIVRLWKEKLEEEKNYLARATGISKEFSNLNTKEIQGIEFAEKKLDEIISDLEEGKL